MKHHRTFAGMAVLSLAIIVLVVVTTMDAHAAHAVTAAMPFGDSVFHIATLAVAGVAADLRGKRAKAVDDFAALTDKMNADDYVEVKEDQTAYDGLKAEIAGYDAKIKRAEEAATLKASVATIVPGQSGGNAKVYPIAKRRYGKLRAFKGPVDGDGFDAEERAYRSGMFILAALLKDHSAHQVAREWCLANGMATNLKAQAEGVNSAGGFLVPIQFETAIIDLREEYGMFRQECRMVPMGSDTMTIPRRVSGVTAYWVGENSQITESQKGWGQVQLVAKKLGALSRMSTELAEDAVISIADDLAQEMAYAFAQAEDSAGWNGDGTATYGGIVGVKNKLGGTIGAGQFAGAMDAASGHDTFAEIDATDLSNLMAKLPKYAEKNAKWYCSQPCWNVVFQRLMAAAGGVTIQELSGGKPRRGYLGYDVVIDQTLPTATTDLSDLPMLYFGDLSLGARMGERRGIRVKTSDDRYFEYDQIGVQATERVDIVVHDVGDATTPGPIVALIGE